MDVPHFFKAPFFVLCLYKSVVWNWDPDCVGTTSYNKQRGENKIAGGFHLFPFFSSFFLFLDAQLVFNLKVISQG